jgi:hypothetical protein
LISTLSGGLALGEPTRFASIKLSRKVAGEELPARAPHLGAFIEVGDVHRDRHDVIHLATRGLQQLRWAEGLRE